MTDDLIPVTASINEVAAVKHYIENALAGNTRRAYRADLDHYRAWGGDIPASPETIASYLTAHASILSIATLSRRLVSIGKAHALRGYDDPTKSQPVRLTFRGIRRVHGKPQTQVSPVLKEDLIVMLNHAPGNLKGARDRALLLLGFCAALRRSELVAVQVEDIEFNSNGLILTLTRSKTDQGGAGRKIGVARGRNGGRICPVASVEFWLQQSGIVSGPLLRSITKGGVLSARPLSDRAVANIVKDYAAKAGLDPARYSGHSLRSGLATSAAEHGYSSWEIRRQTGHASDAMLQKYIRLGSLFQRNASALF